MLKDWDNCGKLKKSKKVREPAQEWEGVKTRPTAFLNLSIRT